MQVMPKYNRHFMPWALLAKASGIPPPDPYTKFFFLLIVGLRFN